MEEDWDAEIVGGVSNSQPKQAESWNVPKLRGFGRGKPIAGATDPSKSVMENGFRENGFGKSSRGFGKSNSGVQDDDDWGESNSGGGFGKSSGGFGKSRGFGKSDRGQEDDWGDSNKGSGRSGGFGKPSGGFGKPSGGFGKPSAAADDDWSDTPATNGFGGRAGGRGGFGGRGGGSFGGGRKGGDGGCHKCGEDGHFARECPNGGGGGGGRDKGGRGCHKCGEEGHFARECPSGGGGGGGFRGSRGGGRDGGFGGGRGGRGGFRARGGFGDAGSGSEADSNQGFGRRSGFGDRGDSDQKNSGGFGSGCRKCGEEGHFARECPNGGGEGEKPREIYVPPTVDDDTLFKEGIHQGINFDKYDNIQVDVTGSNKVPPISSFEEAGLMPTFLKNVQRAGYTKPTPIQKYAIPSIMAGRDLMGCAQTGSGKTAAFILPVLTAMIREGLTSSALSEVKAPQTIVVAPTRELACQIYKEARKFSLHTDLRPVVVYGGVSVAHQMKQVDLGANLVVGTPGRLLDFIEKGAISLEKVKYLILDEADRMLDMGFEPSIRKLVDSLGMPPKSERQTLLFSATFKPDIQQLAADFLNDYLFITVGIVGGACTDVEQTFLEVDRLQKREYLCDILNTSGTNRVLVFVGQKRNADFLASFLSQSGYPTTTIHGDRLQREREEALRDFKTGKSPVLIATNVAARGLDIPDVTHVVNYDLPSDIDEYVHRIGRTGRCGNLGKATSFYSNDMDSALASSLVKILCEARQEVPDWLADYAASAGSGGGDRFTGHFASRDIRHKKFDNGGDYSKGAGNDYRGHGDNYGGSYNTVTADDDEMWD